MKNHLWSLGPITLILQSLPYKNFEPITPPDTPPWGWESLDVTIGNEEQAKAMVDCVIHSNQNRKINIFADGASGNKNVHPAELGAAAVGISRGQHPLKRTVKERLDGSIWTIDEAELFAILIGLRSCMGESWKRIDVFSDSQTALHRLNASYTADRTKPGQFLVRHIRSIIAELRKRRYVESKFWWIPGHDNIEPHDEADALAKEAARLPLTTASDDPVLKSLRERTSIKKAKEWISSQALIFEQTLFDLYPHNSLKEVSPTFQHKAALQTYLNMDW